MWAGPRWVPLDAPHPFRAEGAAGPLERPEAGERPPNVVALDQVDRDGQAVLGGGVDQVQ